ncbi:f-box/lrr-repeat protein [Anaeramoeba flamelloides]|uniref:F-box/lrr-repeat protein n=1 Tax=Anaeramoeba flamelloides TaxID=1746091 RepID=A0AAV7Y804_9EUKA|nr:f-box/lrr-repeat protein [Anaeramoeba flamelloides]
MNIGDLLNIFSYLPFQKLKMCGLVCQKWNRIIQNEMLNRKIDFTFPKIEQKIHSFFGNVDSFPLQSRVSREVIRKTIAKSENLLSINFTGCTRLDEFQIFGSICKYPITETLQELNLSEMQEKITDYGFRNICKFTSLRKLSLATCAMINDFHIELIVNSCENLEDINLDNCFQLTDRSIQSITSKLKSKLKKLSIASCPSITETCLIYLFDNECTSLESLDLSNISVFQIEGEQRNDEKKEDDKKKEQEKENEKEIEKEKENESEEKKVIKSKEKELEKDQEKQQEKEKEKEKENEKENESENEKEKDKDKEKTINNNENSGLESDFNSEDFEMQEYLSQILFQFGQACNKLKTLNLNDHSELNESCLIILISELTELETLYLDGCEVTDNLIKIISETCPKLETLSIQDADISVNSLSYLFESCECLTNLNLNYVDGINDDLFTFLIEQNKNDRAISVLQLTANCVSDYGVKYFIENSCWTNQIRELDLENCLYLSDHTLAFLSQYSPQIQVLSVSCCPITDQGLVFVANNCKKLISLNINDCEKITSKSLDLICSQLIYLKGLSVRNTQMEDSSLQLLSQSNPYITMLALPDCKKITDKGLVYLSNGCKMLQWVDCQNCSQITTKAIQTLSLACDDLQMFNISGIPNLNPLILSKIKSHKFNHFSIELDFWKCIYEDSLDSDDVTDSETDSEN